MKKSLATLVALASGVMSGYAGAAPLPAGYLSTSGNQIVASDGTPVRLACAGYLNHGDSVDQYVGGIASAGFNCVRVAWYNQRLTQDITTIDAIVAAAKKVGLKVILDYHGNEIPGPSNKWLAYPCNGLPFDSGEGTNETDGCGDKGSVTRDKFVKDWARLAKRYTNEPTVIGMDLTNEPHQTPKFWKLNPGGATWGDDSATDLRKAYQEAGDAILAVNPHVLIIAEAIQNWNATFLNGAPNTIAGANDLTLAASKPVALKIPQQLVYSVHEYPGSISGQKIDSGTVKIQSMNTGWGYLVAKNIAPVWIGEIGASLDGIGSDSAGAKLADEQAWSATMVAYLNGQSGGQGGPTFSSGQQAVGTDWWAWGRLEGEAPDGTLDKQGAPRVEQQRMYAQLR